MAFELMEKVVDDFESELKSNMPARLDELEVKYADNIALKDIQAYYIAEQAEIPEYPVVTILGDNIAPNNQGGTWFNGIFNLTIVCTCIDQDTQILKRELYRYLRAIAEIVKACQGKLGVKVDIGNINYSPMFGKDGSFLSDASIQITVIKLENL